MLHNKPLKLKVSNKEDMLIPISVLQFLVVFAALVSPNPAALTILAILMTGAWWVADTLKKPKTNKLELILVIFPDGRVRLESAQSSIIEGFLDGQQWCTRWLAVLRVTHDDMTRKLVIQPAQQRRADDFRRLTMWLRQDLFGNTAKRKVLDS